MSIIKYIRNDLVFITTIKIFFMKISNLLVFAVLFSLLTMSCDNEEPIPVLEGDWALTSLETELLTTISSSFSFEVVTPSRILSNTIQTILTPTKILVIRIKLKMILKKLYITIKKL